MNIKKKKSMIYFDKNGNLYNRSESEGTKIYRENNKLKTKITKLDT